MKRQRGRGRKPGGGGHHHHGGGGNNNNPHRAMESNGPEIKVRGPASHIHERYLQLARDAASSGDRVLSENYLQHADHYFRLWRMMQPAMPPPQAERFTSELESEGDEEGADEGAEDGEIAAEGDEQPDVDFPQGQQQQQQFDRGGDGERRGRRRRGRFREGGEREGGGESGGEQRRERAEGEQRADREGGQRDERPPRRERQPRERDGDQGPEGFSNGPKPAFLRGD